MYSKTAALLLAAALAACGSGESGTPPLNQTTGPTQTATGTNSSDPTSEASAPSAQATTPQPLATAAPTSPAGLPTQGYAVAPTLPIAPPTATATQASTPAVQPTSATAASPTPAGPVETVVETVATGLDTPWDLEFAPDRRLFFTERPGRVRVIESGELVEQPVLTVDIATNTAEGGLLGIALDPNFERNGYIYVMYTYDGAGDASPNRISRFKLREDRALEEQVLVSDIPGAAIHDGGRLSFGPDGKLYATTGDAAATENAQSLESLSGKILRMNPDGSVPEDNPFPDSLVYSLGHRNPQGLAWRPGDEELFSTEHGATGNDEVNRIQAGENYGWPMVEGDEHGGEYQAPIAFYTPSIAPSGATFYNDDAIPQWRG
ncbi:MAG: PQQ-dependent sugar dehydrogenase, partial [Chloroflexia bacterium]